MIQWPVRCRLMDTGNRPRELTGALDLIRHYQLLPYHEFFCKKPHPASVLETHYLYNVVGDTDIRKGDGMQLDQLVHHAFSRGTRVCIRPLDLDVLGEAFHLWESASVDLPSSEKGIPIVAEKSSQSKVKDKHKKHKVKDREKDKELKKHKHQIKEDKKNKRHEDEDIGGIKKHKKSKAV